MRKLLIVFAVGLFWSCTSETEEKVKINEPDGSEASSVTIDSLHPLVEQRVGAIPIPDSLTFCGEPVPLHIPDVRERLERELLANTYRHSRTLLILERSKRWKPFIDNILTEENVPTDFFYLAIAESELDNNAKSPAGAMGMWQIMKTTGKEYGLVLDNHVDQRRDPELAARVACEYLKRGYKKFENWTKVAASYNMGMAGLKHRLEEQLVDSYYDLFLYDETSRYVFRILALKVICENPESYGYAIPDDQMYAPFVFDTIRVSKDIDDLNVFAKEKGTNYKLLRQYNPWLNDGRHYKLNVPKKKSYLLKIPKTALPQDSVAFNRSN